MPAGHPRLTQTALTLSGQDKLRPQRYSSYNLVPGQVIPRDVVLTPPKHYEKQTKKAFKTISSNLIAMGALSEQDLVAFGVMMDSLNDYYKCDALLIHLDKTVIDMDEEYLKQRDKILKRKGEASDRFYKWTSRFGITPTERTRLVCGEQKQKEEDPLDILVN